MKSLTKVSFFKLPIILALSYWLMGLVYIVVMRVIDSNDIDIVAFIFSNLTYTFYYGIPKYLLMIFISTVALNRCNVHIMTEKNILLIVVLALILTVITQLVSMFVASPLLHTILANDHYTYYYDSHLFFIFYRIAISLIYCLIIGLICYFGILSMQDVFERDLELVAITKENSTKLHLILFIMLFSFVFLSLSIPMLTYLEYNMYYYDDRNQIKLIAYLLSIMLSVVILYFLIRNIFSCPFATLQAGRLIKSTIFSTIYVALFNGIVGTVLFIIILIIAFGSRSGESAALVVLFLGAIFQLVITCLIVRAVTRRYFSITYNKSIHNESTI